MSDLERLSHTLGNGYTVTAVIAQPPYGTVVTAHRAGASPHCLTILADDVVAQLRDPDAFVATMQQFAAVPHAALAPVVVAGRTTSGAPFYGTTHSDAQTGHERIVAGRLPTATQLAADGRELALALAALHTAGLVHGLVEPDRIRFHQAGTRLEDAGLYAALRAGGLEEDEIVRVTRPGAYPSPEQQAGREPDARSDVYGLGAALYELLTGKPPFGGRTTTMVMASVLADEPATDVEGDGQAPGHVADAIVRALEKAPDDRWPSATAFAHALAAPDAAEELAEPANARQGCLPVAIFLCSGIAALAVHFAA